MIQPLSLPPEVCRRFGKALALFLSVWTKQTTRMESELLKQVRTMMPSYQTSRMEAVTGRLCSGCRTQLLSCDKFCRWCGRRQANSYNTAINLSYPDDCETKVLVGGTEDYPLNSSPLIHIATRRLSARTATPRPDITLHRLVGIVITIPIWILIVLLSPLEAYKVSKAVANRWTARMGDNQGQNLEEKRLRDVENY
jgi:hypothetical protein